MSPTTPLLKVFLIHTSTLTIRMQKIEPIIQLIKSSGQKAGYKVDDLFTVKSLVSDEKHVIQLF